MEKYHIYEEIGKGSFSQIFKGREKKKIEYVAIKRIEKSEMTKIVAEVQVMHKLSHAHILRFYDWYETRHNLWLILEYCTGGDLESIVKQDGHLPETSVRIFGLDMIAGLKYLHSLGYIHGDMRPRNFLIDEYGIVKLSDFKFTTKIPNQPLGQKAILERGIPAYMSPELFTAEGVHSFQSDFWALGCVLYELRRGFLPFGNDTTKIEELMENIRVLDPINRPVVHTTPAKNTGSSRHQNSEPPLITLSASLTDLLEWLLEKAPMNRCDWNQLSLHPFWNPANPPPPTNLPAQPAYENLVRDIERARSELLQKQTNAEFELQHGELWKHHDLQTKPTSSSTPLKLPAQGSTPSRGLDSVAPTSSAGGSHQKPSRRQWDEDEAPRSQQPQRRVFDEHESKQKDGSPRGKGSLPPDPNAVLPSPRADFASAAAAGHNRGADRNSKPAVIETPFRTQQSQLQADHVAATAPTVPTTAQHQGVNHVEFAWDMTPEQVLAHASDNQVKPIVGNRAIEDVDEPDFNDKNVSFPTFRLDRIAQMAPTDLEAHMTQIYKLLYKSAVSGQSSVANAAVVAALTERVTLLQYIASVASSAEVANIVLNTHFLTLILKLLKTTTNYQATQPLRNQSPSQNVATAATSLAQQARYLCAHTLALMLRYATFVQPPAIRARDDHIVGTLIHVLRDSVGSHGRAAAADGKMRRKAMAALGEMLFYISAQDEETTTSATSNATEGAQDKWTLPAVAIEFLIKCVKDESDEVVKHYAAKTVENILAQGGFSYRKRFISIDLCLTLLDLSQNSRLEALQATCAMSLYHSLYFVLNYHQDPNSLHSRNTVVTPNTVSNAPGNSSRRNPLNATLNNGTNGSAFDPFAAPAIISAARFTAKIFEKANLASILNVFQDSTPKVQQAFLNLLLLVFLAPLGSHSGVQMIGLTSEASTTNQQKEIAIDSAHLATVQTLLAPYRSYFLRAHHALLPALLRLVEQGSGTPIRAKSLLLLQAVCSHMPVLLPQLPERRVATLLIRILEPYLSSLEGQYTVFDSSISATVTNTTSTKKIASPTYLMKAAMCMTVFLRQGLLQLVQVLATNTEEIVNSTTETASDSAPATARWDKTPSRNNQTGVAGNAASPNSPNKAMRSARGAAPTTTTIANNNNSLGRLSFSHHQYLQAAELLRVVTALLSQPALHRLVLPATPLFLQHLAQAFQALPAARARLAASKHSRPQSGHQFQSSSSPTSSSSANSAHGNGNSLAAGYTDALAAVEQACLGALEYVSQVEIPSYFLHSHPSSSQNKVLAARQQQWTTLITHILQSLLPAVARLLTHPDSDLRIVLTGTLRRLAPVSLRTYFLNEQQQLLQGSAALDAGDSSTHVAMHTAQTINVLVQSLQGMLMHVASQLSDVAPVPQYVIRLYQEILAIHPLLAKEIVNVWRSSGVLTSIIHLLKVYSTSSSSSTAQTPAQSDGDNDDASSVSRTNNSSSQLLDPQLVTLLRNVWDCGAESLLLQSDIAGSLTVAIIATVYGQINYPFSATSTMGATSSPSGSFPRHVDPQDHDDNHLTNTSVHYDLLLPLVEMLYAILHHVLKVSTNQSHHNNSSNKHSPSRPSSSSAADQQQQQLRRYVTSLRATSPALLLLVAYTEHVVGQTSTMGQATHPRENNDPELDITHAHHQNAHYLLELSAKCLGMLFDLFPDTLASQLLSKQSVLLDQATNQSNNNHHSVTKNTHGSPLRPASASLDVPLTPRLILANVLFNRQVEIRIVSKVLKILYGVCKVAVNMGHVLKAQELVLQEPVHSRLVACSRWTRTTPFDLSHTHQQQQHQQHSIHSNTSAAAVEVVSGIQRIANQLLDLGLSLS